MLTEPKAKRKGLVSEALFSFVDIVPTLLDMAGITDRRMGCDGIIQAAALNGDAREIRDNVTLWKAYKIEIFLQLDENNSQNLRLYF